MGRLFDSPLLGFIVIIVILAAVVVPIIVVSVNKSKRTEMEQVRTMAGGQAEAVSGQARVDQLAYMRGLSYRSNATVFGVIGIFILGIVFGPLALVQASRAEALGVKATAGKVLGWICVAFAILWILFIVIGLARR